MTLASPAVRAAPRPATAAPLDWVLSVEWRESEPVRLGGVQTLKAGPWEIFVDGTIADRAEWSRELQLPPDASDAELVLGLLSRHGAGALTRLRGSFVVAIADRGAGQVCVLRDPLGSHPLFYADSPAGLCVASTPQPLLARPGVSRDLNREALADHLCKRWPERQETFFRAVRRVPPGWQVVSTRGGVTASRYWNPVGDAIDWLSDDESDGFDAVLDRAVDRGLQGARAAVLLSGGFDSVSVAAVAAARARACGYRTPLALSLGFPSPECDERLVQTSVAQTLGFPLHLEPFQAAAGRTGLLAAALDLNAGLAAPLFNTWMPAYLSLIRHGVSEGADTILTGEGGDEWLGVSPFLGADLIRHGDLAGLVRLALTAKRSYDLGWRYVLRNTIWRYTLRPVAGMLAHRAGGDRWDRQRASRVTRTFPAWIAPDSAIRQAQAERALRGLTPADPEGGFYSRESRQFLDHPLTSWLFEEQFQFGRRLGVRYVHPYWDPDLLVHVYRTRPERLNRGNRSKGLVRETVARRFPSLGFERQRKVTAVQFFSSLVTAEGPPLGEQHSDFAGLAALGVLEPAGARAFMRAAWQGTPQAIGRAWNLVNLESWVRQQLH